MFDEALARAASLDAVPGEMRALDQWLVWRFLVRGKAGKPTKVPFVPWWPDQAASSTDPATWDTFGRAVEAYANVRSLAGVGFVFRAGGGMYGMDLDESLEPDGTLRPWARDVYDRCGLAHTYVEVSPSLTGIKAWLLGELPHDPSTGEVVSGRNRKRKDAAGKPIGGGVEMYQDGRFFTVTGRRFPGSADAVTAGNPDALARVFHSLAPKVDRTPPRAYAPGSAPAAGDKVERCWKFLMKCPDAISGANGHDKTLRAACETVRFDLDPSEAAELLRRWNDQKCDEKWTDAELAKKLRDAQKHAGGERGRRLAEGRRAPRRLFLNLSLTTAPGGDRGVA